MVCKESVRPSPPRIILLITAVTTCPPPAPLPFFSVLFFLRCKFATFFFFWIGLVLPGGGGSVGASFCFLSGGLACMLPNVQTTFPPPCPAPLPFIPSCFRPFEVLVCCWIFFFLCTSNREEVFFCNAFGGVGSDLGGWRS